MKGIVQSKMRKKDRREKGREKRQEGGRKTETGTEDMDEWICTSGSVGRE